MKTWQRWAIGILLIWLAITHPAGLATLLHQTMTAIQAVGSSLNGG